MVTQVKIFIEAERSTLTRETVYLIVSGNGYDKFAFQRDVGGWHDKRISACTGTFIHLLLCKFHRIGRDGPDLLQLATIVRGNRDNYCLTFFRELVIDCKLAAVIFHKHHLLLVNSRSNGDVFVILHGVAEVGNIGSHVNRVGLQGFFVAIRIFKFERPSVSSPRIALLIGGSGAHHFVDGIAVVSRSFDDDDIICHRLDGVALFASDRIEQRHVSMLLLVDSNDAFIARWRIVDGDVAIAHLEDQHVLVFDKVTFRRKQQTEVVKHRTFVAALILVVGYSFYKQFQFSGCDIDLVNNELGNPVIHGSRWVGNNHRVSLVTAGGNDTYLCTLGPAGINAGNGCYLQFVTILSTVRERLLADVHGLRHAVDATGAPIFITDRIGKYHDGKSLTIVYGGIVPRIHAFVSEAVFQGIMVNQRGPGGSF